MFAPKIAKPQAKVAESSARRLAPQIGNQATLQLLARQTSSSAGSAPAGGHEQKVTTDTMTAQELSRRGSSWNFSKIPLFPHERAGRAQPLSVRSAQPGLMQPKLAIGNHNPGGEAKEEEKLQKKEAAAIDTVPGEPPASHEVLRSPGQALDAATRAYFEPRVGRDFSDVRVHTDGDAAVTAFGLGAAAYTLESHIVFAPG